MRKRPHRRPGVIRRLVGTLLTSLARMRDQVLLLLGVAGALRRCELVALDRRRAAVDAAPGVGTEHQRGSEAFAQPTGDTADDAVHEISGSTGTARRVAGSRPARPPRTVGRRGCCTQGCAICRAAYAPGSPDHARDKTAAASPNNAANARLIRCTPAQSYAGGSGHSPRSALSWNGRIYRLRFPAHRAAGFARSAGAG
jgi:hypothetical protein